MGQPPSGRSAMENGTTGAVEGVDERWIVGDAGEGGGSRRSRSVPRVVRDVGLSKNLAKQRLPDVAAVRVRDTDLVGAELHKGMSRARQGTIPA